MVLEWLGSPIPIGDFWGVGAQVLNKIFQLDKSWGLKNSFGL